MSSLADLPARVTTWLRGRDPRLVLIWGAVLSAIALIALAGVLIAGSLDTRPALRTSASLILLQTSSTSGATDIRIEVGDPLDLTELDSTVQLDIVATVGDPNAETWLVISEDIASHLEDCTAIRTSDPLLPFDDLSGPIQEALELVDVRYPSRGTLDGKNVDAPGVGSQAGSIVEQSYLAQKLTMGDAPDGFDFQYDFVTRNYPAWSVTISCSLATEVVARRLETWPALSNGPVLVESITVASRMAGGGEDALARASYVVTLGDSANWTWIGNTFADFTRTRGAEGAPLWRGSGDYWWRISDAPLGVLQPAGYALMEHRDAENTRIWVRLSAAFAITLAVGLLVIAARRAITRGRALWEEQG